MKTTTITNVRLADFAQYLKEKGKISDQVLIGVKYKKANQSFDISHEGPDEILPVVAQSRLDKLLAEGLYLYLKRKGIKGRIVSLAEILPSIIVRHDFPKIDHKEHELKRIETRNNLTLKDLVNCTPENIFDSWQMGKKTLAEIIKLFEKEDIPKTYQIFSTEYKSNKRYKPFW